MDKKKTLMKIMSLLGLIVLLGVNVNAQMQTPAGLQFCDRSYNYGIGNDTVRI